MTGALSIIGLFCEDIRTEAGGMHTIVGILPENVDFPQWPATLPKLHLYVRYLMDPHFDPGPVSVRWVMPEGNVIAQVQLPTEMVTKARTIALANKAPTVGFISQMVTSPFSLSAPGRVQAIAHVNDQSFVCGSLYVNVKPRPSS